VKINEHGFDSSAESSEFDLAAPTSKKQFKEYVKTANERSYSIITDNKVGYVKLHLLGILKSLIDPGRFELYTYWGQDTRNLSLTEHLYAGNYQEVVRALKQGGVLFYLFLSLLLLSLIKFASAILSLSKVKSPRIWFLTFIVLYFIGLAGPIGSFRFLLPALIPYLILASLGMNQGLKLFQKRSVS
jgi:hypothetical protein